MASGICRSGQKPIDPTLKKIPDRDYARLNEAYFELLDHRHNIRFFQRYAAILGLEGYDTDAIWIGRQLLAQDGCIFVHRRDIPPEIAKTRYWFLRRPVWVRDPPRRVIVASETRIDCQIVWEWGYPRLIGKRYRKLKYLRYLPIIKLIP